jgi:hypothetical protein
MYHQQRGLGGFRGLRGIVSIQTVQGRDLVAPPPPNFPRRGHFTKNFPFENNELMNLMTLAEKFHLSSLYSKPGCHLVSKAFSVSNNTAAVNKLLMKFKSHVVREPHALERRAVTRTKTKLTYI